MTPIEDTLVHRQERRFLDWMVPRLPHGLTADRLTVLSIFGAVLVLTGYVAAQVDPRFLGLAVAGYVIHWFGDALGSRLARHAKGTRPGYGYFLDHSVDALCILLMVGGMGLSGYVRTDVALFVVMGYFALSIHVFLKNHVTGQFKLSFMGLGPTEIRMIFVAMTLWMVLQGQGGLHLGGALLSDYDVVLLVIGAMFMGLFTVSTMAMIAQLRAIEGNGRMPRPATETPRKATSRHAVAEVQLDGLTPAMERTAY